MANTKKTASAEAEKNEAVEAKTEADNAAVETENATEKSGNESKEKADTSDVLNTLNKTVDSVAGASESKESARKPNIDLNDEILVRSVTFGGLTWISPKTNAHYRWNEIGATEFVPFNELITMNNTDQAFLKEPLVILQDERAVDYFRLKSVYEKIAVVDSLEELFKEGDLTKVEQALRDIRNTSMRNVAISKIKELRETHTLNNIDIIRLVEKILCFDME